MGRKKIVESLNVYLEEKKVGRLKRGAGGAVEFRYEDEWIETGYPISLSLPLADRFFTGAKASFYFDNLLPDSKKVLTAIAEKFQASSIKSFDILSAVGRDCVGALSFFDEDVEPSFLKKMTVKAISDEEIARRIRGLSSDTPLGMDEDSEFRISLAGAQEKMALLFRKNRWWQPTGATPTSQILKKSVGTLMKGTKGGAIDFGASVDNEWICLRLAKEFGIDSAEADIAVFEDQRVLNVSRFDRVWKDLILRRVSQEDFCQATGTSPTLKLESKGGPSIRTMMKIVQNSSNKEDQSQFFKTLLFNDLIHNPDSHAKNFSLFQVSAGYLLTPMYDLLSGHFLSQKHSNVYQDLTSALSVNGKNRFSDISILDWQSEASACGLMKEEFDLIVDEIKSAMKKMDIPQSEWPADLDQTQLDLIISGVQSRAGILFQS